MEWARSIFQCQRRRENQCLACRGKALPSSARISMFLMYLHSFLLVHTVQACHQTGFNMFHVCQEGLFYSDSAVGPSFRMTAVCRAAGKSPLSKSRFFLFFSSIISFEERRTGMVNVAHRSALLGIFSSERHRWSQKEGKFGALTGWSKENTSLSENTMKQQVEKIKPLFNMYIPRKACRQQTCLNISINDDTFAELVCIFCGRRIKLLLFQMPFLFYTSSNI